MKAQHIPVRSLEWFTARIGKEINSVHGHVSTTIKVDDEKAARELYLDTQFTFGVRFTDKP